jgi:hypothetical protein
MLLTSIRSALLLTLFPITTVSIHSTIKSISSIQSLNFSQTILKCLPITEAATVAMLSGRSPSNREPTSSGEFKAEKGTRNLGLTICSHCNTCKKISGGAYTLNQIVDKSALKFLKGEDQLKVYTYTGVSGAPHL